MIKTIHVTQEDIDSGIPEEGDNCPVYFAIERVCPDVFHVGYEYALFVTKEDRHEQAWFPDEVNVRITAFDNHKRMEPFEFDLEVPDSVLCVQV